MTDNNNVSVLDQTHPTREKAVQKKTVKHDKHTVTPARAKVEKAVEQTSAKVEKAVEQTSAEVEKTVEQATARLEEAVQQTSAEVETTVEQATARLEEAVQQTSTEVETTVDETLEGVEKIIDEGLQKLEQVAETVFDETTAAFSTGYLKPARPAYLAFLGAMKMSTDTVESWLKKLTKKGEAVEKEGFRIFKHAHHPTVKA